MRRSVVTVLILGLGAAWPAAAREPAPFAVSPGSPPGSRIAEPCPTFSWSAVAGARGYELVVFRLREEGDVPAEVLRREIAGAALSWTPALEECLARGGRFGWTVRALGSGGPSGWSEAALFEVAALPGDRAPETTPRRSGLSPSGAPYAAPPLASRVAASEAAAAAEDAATGASPPGAPPLRAAGTTAPFSVKRSDGGFLVAELLNRSGSGDRTAALDLSNGNGTATTWRFGVGGAGNGFGLTDGELYFERVGSGLVLWADDFTTRVTGGYPTLLAELQTTTPIAGGCGVLCGRTGLQNSNGVSGEAEGTEATGVAGLSTGTGGYGVLGAATGSGGVGVKGIADDSTGVAGEFELLTTFSGDLLVGKVEGARRFRVDHTGKGFFNGGTQTGGADFAESMEVLGERGDYEPGDVMMIDPTGRRRLRLAVGPYSSSVAGVVSTRPGVLATPHPMDSPELSTEIPLAVVGIVPCKVSAENGPIRPGDLLVSSSSPGRAMRGSRHKRMLGAVLGKALEPLERGTGTIEVLVMLQ